MDTWTIVPRAEAVAKGEKVIKVTWAFRQKRISMGSVIQKKNRVCVRGDTMGAGIDYGESFSPVVQWLMECSLWVSQMESNDVSNFLGIKFTR